MTASELKAAILQAAVRGELTGRMSPADYADDADFPFPIPADWKWVKLGEVCELLSGQDFTPDKYTAQPVGIPYITGASNLSNGRVIINRWTEHARVIAENGDLLFVCKGAGVGKMALLSCDKAHIARQIMAIRPKKSTIVLLKYIEICLNVRLQKIRAQMEGLIPGVTRAVLLNLPIPLPPLEEQSGLWRRWRS